jgi:hypothetical protein
MTGRYTQVPVHGHGQSVQILFTLQRREALRYLETVGRQGYCFLVGGALEIPPPLTAGPLVGRQGEGEALARWFQRAASGARQLVLVSGEAGVGKTAMDIHSRKRNMIMVMITMAIAISDQEISTYSLVITLSLPES